MTDNPLDQEVRAKITQVCAELDEIEKEMAATRDKLDQLIARARELEDSFDEAWDDLIRARDALSKYV